MAVLGASDAAAPARALYPGFHTRSFPVHTGGYSIRYRPPLARVPLRMGTSAVDGAEPVSRPTLAMPGLDTATDVMTRSAVIQVRGLGNIRPPITH
jgi:hypothetical protein